VKNQIILVAIMGFMGIVGLGFQNATPPLQLNWMQLQRVPTRPVQIAGVEGLLPLPVFPAAIKAYHGKTIDIDGYIIPLDKTGKTVVLSGYAMAECFFCGSGGPETVMEVMLTSPIKYTSKRVKVRGKLTLNTADPEKLMYILKEGKLVEN
jgi:hypothetical protein